MAAVVTFGEAILRLSPPGHDRLEQARCLELWPGGAELNVAVGLARLGTSSAWVSRLPQSALGRLVDAHARANGVDTAHVRWSRSGRIALYFLEAAEAPRASAVLYDRAGSAFSTLDPADLDWAKIVAGARAFHVSGITPSLSEACAEATAAGLGAARASGCRTSYDVNLRRRLTTPAEARALLERLAPALDALFVSQRDAEDLFDELDGEPAAVLRERLGIPLVVVSGSEGAFDGARPARYRIAVGDTTARVTRPAFDARSTIGSGDAFCAGFLHALLEGHDLEGALRLGDAVSALKLTIPGDAPLVTSEEVDELLAGSDAQVRR